MVSLTFYGGVNEIGGNKILVEDGDARVFLDFGQSFSLLKDFFVPEAFLTPRTRFGLRDLLALGLMPSVKGLYSKKALAHSKLEFAEPEFDAVFISHAHSDHVAHLEFLHPEIPIYMGECTKLILDAVQETTSGMKLYSEENRVELFTTGKKILVGSLAIHPIHVDHSIPGAYGFIVETSEGAVVYTGDFRMHGPRADMTQEFVEKAASFKPKALIIEGTRVTAEEKRKNHTEDLVLKGSLKVVGETNGLVLAMRYPRDLDRFRSLYKVAKETGREMVISMKSAHLLKALQKDKKLGLPDPLNDPLIRIHDRKLLRESFWEEPLKKNSVDSDYIGSHKKGVLLELDFYGLTELVDINPENGACIHSMSEPFEEDPISQVSDRVLDNWLMRFNLSKHQLHASGHAAKSQVFDVIEKIGPEKVFPVHTLEPELFARATKKTVAPQKNKACAL